MRAVICIALLAITLAACQPKKGQYDWGGYSSALNNYYRDPAQQGAYREALQQVIASGQNARVPPGIYAELGYLELAAGNNAEAKRLFEREQSAWPESAPFMKRMIGKMEASDAAPSAPVTPAPATAAPPAPASS